MPIRSPHVRGLIRRRGSIIAWQHAVPVDERALDPLTDAAQSVLGAPRVAAGPFGESYGRLWTIRAYLSRNISRAFLAEAGLVEAGDYQLDLPTPFVQEPDKGIVIRSASDLDAYNHGNFYVIPRNGMASVDRFMIFGKRWTIKASATPIIDNNATVCWRVLIAEAEA